MDGDKRSMWWAQESSLIQQDDNVNKEQTISIADMDKTTNKNQDQAIIDILKQTNYATVMQDFVSNASRKKVYLLLDKVLYEDLQRYEFDRIQSAISNIYIAMEFKEDNNNYILWGYGKTSSCDRREFLKTGFWANVMIWGLICTVVVFIISLIGAILSTPTNGACADGLLCSIFFYIDMICFISFVFNPLLFKYAETFDLTTCLDISKINSFPVIRYMKHSTDI